MVEQADIRVCAYADGRAMFIEGRHILRAAVWRRPHSPAFSVPSAWM